MSEDEERRWRLSVACLHAKVTKVEVAEALGRSPGALNRWEERGDGKRRNALTGADIAAAISELGKVRCPPEALQAGSTFLPEWIDRAGHSG